MLACDGLVQRFAVGAEIEFFCRLEARGEHEVIFESLILEFVTRLPLGAAQGL